MQILLFIIIIIKTKQYILQLATSTQNIGQSHHSDD